jgi:peptidylprolyl isomerase
MKIFILLMLLSFSLQGEEAAAPQQDPVASVAENGAPAADTDVFKISEAFGHLIGKNLESLGFKFDIAQVIKGLQDAAEGKDSPMTEMECVQAITTAQEVAFKHQATENLKKAAEFLAQNGKKEGIVTVDPGKLQYKIEKTGTGAVVEDHDSPLIRYTGRFLDGTVFGSSKEDEMISLEETIPGFTKGLVGMKEGEKRTLFIHPDLGYGTSGYLPPNSLLTFEIEVLKANMPKSEPVDSLSTTHPKPKSNPEIAIPAEEPKVIR